MKPDFPTDAMIEAGMSELHSKWVSLIDRSKLASVYLAMEAAKYVHGDGVTYGLEAARPTKVTNQPIADSEVAELVENLIDAARQDEAQCHFGTAGSRARSRTDLQDATKDIRTKLEALNSQLRMAVERYNELLFEVSKKHEGETRHETALRYIRQAKTSSNDPALSTIKGTGVADAE